MFTGDKRRLRHLRCLALRNLNWPGHKGKDLTNLQSYFTLHEDRKSAAFYTSEKIQGSLNPTWQSFDISRYEDKINTKSRFLVVKVWVGIKNKFALLLDWDVNLVGLVYIADKLQQDTVKYGSNSLIFGMFDKYFVAPVANIHQKPELFGNVMTVDQSTVRNSYRASSVSRIYTVLRATKQTQVTVNKYHRCIEDKLLSSQEKSQKLSCREAMILKRTQMRNELTWQMSRLQAAKDELDKLKVLNGQKEEEINEKFLKLKKRREELSDSKRGYNQTRENFIKEEAQWKIRRKQLIGELATYVYPITENSKKENFICNVKLPDSESFQGCDDTQVAVALGYTGHMVLMMSHILDVPLRYPIEHRSSRSLIKDHIHHKLTEKDNTFPLYSKGKEKFYFNYGVYLLNKNVGQLRFYCGMGTADLRTTLLNIKTLLELRLGTKVDGHNKLKKPGSDIKDKNNSDTHSSLASGGRLSAPDSTDMLESVLAGTKHEKTKKDNDSFSNFSLTNTNTNRQDDTDSGDIHFHPSPDDNFFKISNPVSEKIDIFNDLEAIENRNKVSFSENSIENDTNELQFGRENSLLDLKPRTDSHLTNESNELLGGKDVFLEHQISTLSTTDYHQEHSNFKQFLSIGVTDINSTETADDHGNENEEEKGLTTEEVAGCSNSFKNCVSDNSCVQLDSAVQESTKCNNDSTQNNINGNCDENIASVSMTTEADFPEFQRTFKTMSFKQTEKNDDESCLNDSVASIEDV